MPGIKVGRPAMRGPDPNQRPCIWGPGPHFKFSGKWGHDLPKKRYDWGPMFRGTNKSTRWNDGTPPTGLSKLRRWRAFTCSGSSLKCPKQNWNVTERDVQENLGVHATFSWWSIIRDGLWEHKGAKHWNQSCENIYDRGSFRYHFVKRNKHKWFNFQFKYLLQKAFVN